MGSLVKKSTNTESGTESRENSSSSSGPGSRCDDSIEQVKKIGSFHALFGWPIRKAQVSKKISLSDENKAEEKNHFHDLKFKNAGAMISEIEMMKERFAKVLLGEDMSGSGKGVCTALAISNAITNLYATIFGQLWRLEPLPSEKKSMWKREMEWLTCVSDHIVEFLPSWQTFPDGRRLEVMACRQRSDLFINLPALQTLDNMLIDILDSFSNTEFWYVDQGIISPEADGSASFRETLQRQEEKWWLPVPRVPPRGLTENSRKQLDHLRESTNQILKAAMAINSIALGEMEVPESYLETLPKNGRASLGDFIYRYITSDQFSADCLLDCLDLSSEHVVLDIANRVEATIYIWRRRAHSKPPLHSSRSAAKSSWGMVKDLMVDGDKREMLAERAESLLLCLKQRFPSLPQTTLDTSKIQCNKDVGKSILEGYSRVLESLAFNIGARIDDLIYVDDLTKTTEKLSSVPTKSMIAHKKVSIPYSVPVSSTPFKSTLASPNCSLGSLISPAGGERTPFLHNSSSNQNKPQRRGLGVKRVLTNYLGAESKAKISGNPTEDSCTIPTNGTEDKENQNNLSAHPNGTKTKQSQPQYMVT